MNKKKQKAVLLIHGMGKNEPPGEDAERRTIRGRFSKDFIDATTVSLQRFKNFKDDTLENHVDIHEFNYDAWFDKMRIAMADNAKSMKERLKLVSEVYGMSLLDHADKLRSIEEKFKNDNFLYTHALDVFFYATMLGEKVMIDAARMIADLVENYRARNVYIVAYSLGTSVLHDTLHHFYRKDYDPSDNISDLDFTTHKLKSIWMVSNVSRITSMLNSRVEDPYKSSVKPGDNGSINQFYLVRHKLDPFTLLSRFSPKNDGSWIPESVYTNFYEEIETEYIVDHVNPHDFNLYMKNPQVAYSLFNELINDFSDKITIDELDEIDKKYKASSLQIAIDAFKKEFKEIDVKDIDSIKEFIEAGKKLWKIIENLKKNLENGGDDDEG